MKGNMLSFEPNSPMHGMVLVRYATADDALAAKKALNMSMAGNTMLVASITSDQDVRDKIIISFYLILSKKYITSYNIALFNVPN